MKKMENVKGTKIVNMEINIYNIYITYIYK